MNWNKALLGTAISAYVLVFFITPDLFTATMQTFYEMVLRIAPAIALMVVMTYFFNAFTNKKNIQEHLSTKGAFGWVTAIIGGMISMGPIYLWYPLVADLREKGLTSGIAACFLYNRAIKLPLLPLMASYFGAVYVGILTFWMIIFSILNGLIVERLVK